MSTYLIKNPVKTALLAKLQSLCMSKNHEKSSLLPLSTEIQVLVTAVSQRFPLSLLAVAVIIQNILSIVSQTVHLLTPNQSLTLLIACAKARAWGAHAQLGRNIFRTDKTRSLLVSLDTIIHLITLKTNAQLS